MKYSQAWFGGREMLERNVSRHLHCRVSELGLP